MSPPAQEPLKATLAPVLQALHRALGDDLVAVALFGSRARGDATPESDWDLLVIAHHLPARPLARHFHLKSRLPEEWSNIRRPPRNGDKRMNRSGDCGRRLRPTYAMPVMPWRDAPMSGPVLPANRRPKKPSRPFLKPRVARCGDIRPPYAPIHARGRPNDSRTPSRGC